MAFDEKPQREYRNPQVERRESQGVRRPAKGKVSHRTGGLGSGAQVLWVLF